jgi:S-DNA-T family DNA segregation ATPase FtsK/SpoIIIE
MSVPPLADEPITLPQRPVRAPPSPFPVMAALAPVLVSALVWLVTSSPFALVFAAFGPVIAVASVVDSRWSSRRRLRKDLAAHAVELERISELIDARLDDERRLRKQSQPGARTLLDDGDSAPALRFTRWRVPEHTRVRVVIGTGTLPSALTVDGASDFDVARQLRRRARSLSGVPVDVDATSGIGVVGAPVLARACARAILLQLCNAMAPNTAAVRVHGGGCWEWATALPHSMAGLTPVSIDVYDITGTSTPPDVAGDDHRQFDVSTDVLIVITDSIERMPSSCAVILELTGPTSAVLHHPATGSVPTSAHAASMATLVNVELVSAVESERFARELAELGDRLGVTAGSADLPTSVGFLDAHRRAENEEHDECAAGTSLSAVLGLGDEGAARVDIVRDGPHAIVGGTTGSGKSELLVTWVASMARGHPPEEVTFLLVDFKGGSAFAPLRSLPHVVGVLTDLDDVAAARALASLSAEVLYRERMLSELGCRDVSDAGGAFPRLVIVVDEFAAMLDGFPELSALFVDIAARGRSLGMHLILCTQRPAGVVKDSLLANCGLRMSLRVHNRSDSIAVVGADAAATLPSTQPGRLILASGEGLGRVQVARVTQTELDDIARSRPVSSPIRRPWLDPLPTSLALGDLKPTPGIRLGLSDLPDAQRQETATWRPASDGSVLVVGAARSGKTTLLDTVTAEAARQSGLTFRRVGRDDEETWDVTTQLAASLRSGSSTAAAGGGHTLLLIDDLDSTLARLEDDYATKLRDSVIELLRDGPRHRLWLMISVQRLAGSLGALSGFAGALLILRLANRQEHLMAGGDSAAWVANRSPGNAIWRGATTQIAIPPGAGETGAGEKGGPSTGRHRRHPTAADYDFRSHRITLVVCPSPQLRAERLLAFNRDHPQREPVRVAHIGGVDRLTVSDIPIDTGTAVLVGDSDEWQAQWPLLTALRSGADLLLEGCTVSDYRALTRRRDLPPLLAVPGHAWHVAPGGQPVRVRLP